MGLFRTAVGGMAWTTTSTVIRSIVSLVQVSILTSYLPKSDFGVVAICNLFIGFSQIFLDLGISVGILHKQDITKEQYSSLFWLNIIMGALLTALLCLASPFVSRYYNEPMLTRLLVLLSMTVLFSSIGAQHRTVQQKNMRFKYISVIEITDSLLTLVVAIILVKTGFGIYSLIYSTMFHALLENVVFLVLGLVKDSNISFHFRIKDTLPFLKIGVFSVGSEVLNYFSREFDVIIISATLGKEALGLYSLCKKLVMAVYGSINPILTKVISPMLARLQNDINSVRKIYYDIIETVAFANFPIFFLIALFSFGILNFLYGVEYTDGRYILGLLAIYYGFLAPGNPVGSLQTALGRPDTGFYWNICRIAFCALAVIVGSHFSLEIVCLCLWVTSLITSPLSWRITIRPLIGGRFWEFFFLTFKPFGLCLLLTLPFYFCFAEFRNFFVISIVSIIYIITWSGLVCLAFKDSYIVAKVRFFFVEKIK